MLAGVLFTLFVLAMLIGLVMRRLLFGGMSMSDSPSATEEAYPILYAFLALFVVGLIGTVACLWLG